MVWNHGSSDEYPSMPLIVRVLQHDFPIDREYTEGHVLTEAEATALNQVLVENIKNNVYGWVTRAARGKSVLTAEAYEDLHERISDYARQYQFKIRTRSRPINPFDAEISSLARQYAEVWGTKNGFGPNAHEVYAKYLSLKDLPEIREEARRLILNRQAAVDEALEGIII
jgi:hypothetical protein